MTNADELFEKYRKGECTKEELAVLESWYLELNADKKGLKNEALEAAVQRVGDRLPLSQEKPKSFALWYPYVIAASLFIGLLYAGSLFFYNNKQLEPVQMTKNEQLILPGGNKAILTLSGGKQISLTSELNGTVAQQGNIVITKAADGKLVYQKTGREGQEESGAYNTVTTPRGGQYHLILTDGTAVWLNAESSIKYPTAFNGKAREVFLTGEAYFEVTKDQSRPFYVNSPRQRVQVLGTHFNVNAYDDETIVKTTLLEGSVKVSNLITHVSNLLKPGQQSQVNGGALKVTRVDTQEATAWKNGLFSFNKSDIQTVMRQFSRWYDVEVVYEGAIPEAIITGKVHRDTDLSTALEILTYLDIHFNINGRTITIKP